MLYNVLLMGKNTPKIAPTPWDFVTLPEQDRATAIGKMHKKISYISRVWFGRYPCGLTDTHTHTDVLITIVRYRSCEIMRLWNY